MWRGRCAFLNFLLPLLGKAGSALGAIGGGSKLAGALALGKSAVEIGAGVKAMKGQEAVTPYDNLMSQAAGARAAAEEYGFNPLTMLTLGQTGASTQAAGPPPLASIQMITSGLTGLEDVVTGSAARRRAAEQLNLDLASLQLEKARSGVATIPMSNTISSAPGAVNFGRQSVQWSQAHAAPARVVPARSLGTGPQAAPANARPLVEASQVDPRRETDHAAVPTHAGVMVVDNPNVPFPLYMPTLDGDEALDVTQYPTALAAYAGSAIYDLWRRKRDTGSFWSPEDLAHQEYMRRIREEAAEERRRRRQPPGLVKRTNIGAMEWHVN